MRRRLFYCDNHDMGLPAGHRFPTPKYRKVRELLAADGEYDFEAAPFARRELIERVHDSGYVEGFFSGTLDPQVVRRIGFPWSEGLVRRTLASVGGTLCATQDALDRGFGGNLAGGTHHAFRSEGSGFCVFNDIAIATLWLRHERDITRVGVVDCDVHQGDGTAQIFEDDPQVFTLSLHGRKNFPFRKQRSRLDIELEDGTTDEVYLSELRTALDKVLSFEPQAIFYQSGVDALACDTLGRLALSHDGLKRRDRMVFNSCVENKIPLVITLGGGYGNPIEQTALAHANTYRTALEVFGPRLNSPAK